MLRKIQEQIVIWDFLSNLKSLRLEKSSPQKEAGHFEYIVTETSSAVNIAKSKLEAPAFSFPENCICHAAAGVWPTQFPGKKKLAQLETYVNQGEVCQSKKTGGKKAENNFFLLENRTKPKFGF